MTLLLNDIGNVSVRGSQHEKDVFPFSTDDERDGLVVVRPFEIQLGRHVFPNGFCHRRTLPSSLTTT